MANRFLRSVPEQFNGGHSMRGGTVFSKNSVRTSGYSYAKECTSWAPPHIIYKN